ncbi:MAG: UDP-N-acetylmuramoyl-tripeptide--D-alanyl-D-alanine ligase [Candidatus Magasanikbacteria bacterium]|nr:UDP-N-acetylmuramoyl-tripeptide--D-alanyl-D-alanine ligase [Candidatus Magasanikbacteria bacterium]
MAKFLLEKILNYLAGAILKKYQPEIIGITGSVGKTSTKEAIFTVLKSGFSARAAIRNYNNELGAPLTIIGAESGGKNWGRWWRIFLQAVGLLLKKDKNYPRILILEMAADKPGDIKHLIKLAPCRVGVLTAIGPAHLETFKTIHRVAEEKQLIVRHLKKGGLAIINYDDELAREAIPKTEAEVMTYGLREGALIKAENLKIDQEAKNNFVSLKGMMFKINQGGSLVPVILPGVLGCQHIYAALAGAVAGLRYGLNLVEISERLKEYQPPPSRMRILAGIKYTTLIDDSYNSSPLSASAALAVLAEVEKGEGRKIAVLGEMLELGGYTEEAHQKIGKLAAESGLDFLVTVGERAKMLAEAAFKNGLSDDKIAKFSRGEEAGRFLQEKIQSGDIILIKGSQGVRMEKIVVELMAEPLRAGELVCRQEESWKKK